MKFLDVFNEIEKGNYGLTDEAIYLSLKNSGERIPIWGGNASHKDATRKLSVDTLTKTGKKIKIFEGEGIIISLDGSAGSMTYKNGEKFALNHHAGFITVRQDKKDILNLEYFSIFFQNFFKSLAVSEGSKTLSLNQIYLQEFNFPELSVQEKIVESMKTVNVKLERLRNIKLKLKGLLEKDIMVNYQEYQSRDIPIKQILDYLSGNSGLTEEAIYGALLESGIRYKVLSSSTEDRTTMGEIPKTKINNRDLKVFEDKEGLLVARNGSAGQTRYLEPGKYTINDHAYILYLKSDLKYKIDLQWLAFQYKSKFLSFSSNSDNGTWNMTGFFKQTRIDIPAFEEQLKVVKYYSKVQKYISSIEKIEKKYEELILKELSL